MKVVSYLLVFREFHIYKTKNILKKVTHFRIMENIGYGLNHPYYFKKEFKKMTSSSRVFF